APEAPLLATAIALGVLLGPFDGLLRGLPKLAAPAKEAFGELHNLVLALQARDVAFDARHGRSLCHQQALEATLVGVRHQRGLAQVPFPLRMLFGQDMTLVGAVAAQPAYKSRSEEHTSELQSRGHLVCRLLLEKKKKRKKRRKAGLS